MYNIYHDIVQEIIYYLSEKDVICFKLSSKNFNRKYSSISNTKILSNFDQEFSPYVRGLYIESEIECYLQDQKPDLGPGKQIWNILNMCLSLNVYNITPYLDLVKNSNTLQSLIIRGRIKDNVILPKGLRWLTIMYHTDLKFCDTSGCIETVVLRSWNFDETVNIPACISRICTMSVTLSEPCIHVPIQYMV